MRLVHWGLVIGTHCFGPLIPTAPTFSVGSKGDLGWRRKSLGLLGHMLSEYGNMSSACVFFILDEMRKWSYEEGNISTTGEGLKWGEFSIWVWTRTHRLTVDTVVLPIDWNKKLSVIYIYMLVMSKKFRHNYNMEPNTLSITTV